MSQDKKRHIQAVRRYMNSALSVGHSAAMRSDSKPPAKYRDNEGRYYLLEFADLEVVLELAEAALAATSEVDEAELADVIAEHKLVHAPVSRRSAFCRCNSSVTAGVDDNLAWFEQHRAHAVAEWLRGEGR